MDEKLSCPVCSPESRANKLVFVNYKRDEAFLTCAKRNCIYFAKDTRGNLKKYKFDLNLKRYVLMNPADEENLFVENRQLPPQSEFNTIPQTTAGSASSPGLNDSSDKISSVSEVALVYSHAGDPDYFYFMND